MGAGGRRFQSPDPRVKSRGRNSDIGTPCLDLQPDVSKKFDHKGLYGSIENMKALLVICIVLVLLCLPVVVDHGTTWMWVWDWRFHGHLIDSGVVFAELCAITLLWLVTKPVRA